MKQPLNSLIYDILWLAALYSLYFLQLLMLLLLSLPAHSAPLQGYVNNEDLHNLKPKYDNRCPVHKGRLQFEHCRGYIGILFNKETGEITFIYPESNLIKLGVQAGDFILEVNHERFRPCLTPAITFYPKGSFLDLTISHNGLIRRISVQLIDASKFTAQ
jgi:predicted metalloprotease with PDZ domain